MILSPLLVHTLVDMLATNMRQVAIRAEGERLTAWRGDNYELFIKRTWPKRYVPLSWRKSPTLLNYALILDMSETGKILIRACAVRREWIWVDGRMAKSADEWAAAMSSSFLPPCPDITTAHYQIVGWEKNILRHRPFYAGVTSHD